MFAIFRLRHAHVRKDTRLFTLFHTASDGKLGGAWVRGYLDSCVLLCGVTIRCGHVGQDHSNILSLCNCGCSNIKLWLRIAPWDVHRTPSFVLLYPRQLKYTQHNALFSHNTRKHRQYSTFVSLLCFSQPDLSTVRLGHSHIVRGV